jgi:hypothetical protein
MRRTRMNTAPRYHSSCALVARRHSKMRNGMEEVVGSIPTRSTKSLSNSGVATALDSRLCHRLCHNLSFWCSRRRRRMTSVHG